MQIDDQTARIKPPCIANWRDAVLLMLGAAFLVTLAIGVAQLNAPFDAAHAAPLSLDPRLLPWYALRTVMRMLAALLASLLFTLIYATAAAKSRCAEKVLIPLLDVLQSVPILGYLSATVTFFVALSPHTYLGAELASIFAIFTSQAWNMTFSLYQALRTVPHDLDEACIAFHLTGWQRFWRLELPFAVPGLLWNTMMSLAGGWFFVVASEAITVGTLQIRLPGIGSYTAMAIAQSDLHAVFFSLMAMLITILLYDQLLFRPLVAWAGKFRYEQSAARTLARSWLYSLYLHSGLMYRLGGFVGQGMQHCTGWRLRFPAMLSRLAARPRWRLGAALLWYLILLLAAASLARMAYISVAGKLQYADLFLVLRQAALTLLRVLGVIGAATLIWVPAGVYIGLRPRVAEMLQPVVQFLASFPANLLYPVFVVLIVKYHLSPQWWLTPLMILGTQWYVLFNVIAGASAFPSDFREASQVFHIRGWRWWWRVMLPGILPYYITGAIAASGGAWNASIVSELVSWGQTRLNGGGLGAYIAQMTEAGDFARIALGIAVMSIMVIFMNRALWRPLYAFAERRTRLD